VRILSLQIGVAERCVTRLAITDARCIRNRPCSGSAPKCRLAPYRCSSHLEGKKIPHDGVVSAAASPAGFEPVGTKDRPSSEWRTALRQAHRARVAHQAGSRLPTQVIRTRSAQPRRPAWSLGGLHRLLRIGHAGELFPIRVSGRVFDHRYVQEHPPTVLGDQPPVPYGIRAEAAAPPPEFSPGSSHERMTAFACHNSVTR
jgi:hypothetical protein